MHLKSSWWLFFSTAWPTCESDLDFPHYCPICSLCGLWIPSIWTGSVFKAFLHYSLCWYEILTQYCWSEFCLCRNWFRFRIVLLIVVKKSSSLIPRRLISSAKPQVAKWLFSIHTKVPNLSKFFCWLSLKNMLNTTLKIMDIFVVYSYCCSKGISTISIQQLIEIYSSHKWKTLQNGTATTLP